MLTDSQKKTFVDNSGVLCPHCGAWEIDGSLPVVGVDDGGKGVVGQSVYCNVCEKSWIATYKLVDVEETD